MARKSESEKLDEVIDYLQSVDSYLRDLNERVEALEEKPSKKVKPAPAPKKEKLQPKEASPEPIVPAVTVPSISLPHITFDQNFGIKLFGALGGFSLLLGVLFFLKFAFDNNLIGHLGRIVIGIAAGGVLIAGSELAVRKPKYKRWSNFLAGAGFAIAYFSAYAAYFFPEYRAAIGTTLWAVLLLMSIIAGGAAIFAVRHNTQVIVGEAFFLGYLTVLLTRDLLLVSLSYSLILTVMLIAVSAYKQWSRLALGGVYTTYGLFVWWFGSIGANSFTIPFLMLTAYYVLYTILSFILRDKTSEDKASRSVVMLTSSIAHFGIGIWILSSYSETEPFMGIFAFTMAAVHLGLFRYSQTANESLQKVLLPLAVSFLTIAIPVQFDRALITVAWAIEAVILMWLSFTFNSQQLRYLAYVVGIVTFTKTLTVDTFTLTAIADGGIFASRVWSYGMSSLALLLSAELLFRAAARKATKTQQEQQRTWSALYFLAGSFLITVIIGLEAKDAWITILWTAKAIIILLLALRYKHELFRYVAYLATVLPLTKVIFIDSRQLDGGIFSERTLTFIVVIIMLLVSKKLLDFSRQLKTKEQWAPNYYLTAGAITIWTLVTLETPREYHIIAWSSMAILATIAAYLLQQKALRFGSYLAFAPSIVYLLRELQGFRGEGILSVQSASFVITIIGLYLASYLYQQAKRGSNEEASPLLTFFTATTTYVLWVALEFERAAITMMWAALAFTIFFIGIARKVRSVRLAGLTVFGLVIFKAFLIDTQGLTLGLKIISYIFLGIVLLAVAFLYAKFKDQLTEFL